MHAAVVCEAHGWEGGRYSRCSAAVPVVRIYMHNQTDSRELKSSLMVNRSLLWTLRQDLVPYVGLAYCVLFAVLLDAA